MTEAEAIGIKEELDTGKAQITWAVFQFVDDLKLTAVQESGKIQEFLENMDDKDPYDIRELPAINGVKQYIIMGRQLELPFTEDGLTKKQGEDEIARAMAREQLVIYEEKYPWTRDMIQKGLEHAEKASCHSCVEKRLVQEVAQAVKDSLLIHAPTDELQDEILDMEMWGPREPCPLCTLKHLGQAIVLFNESLTGYPVHRWIAVGHMAEAEAEAPSHEMANRIRAQRLEAMDDLDYIPHLTDLLTEVDAIVRAE
jgi:hypothetical protein